MSNSGIPHIAWGSSTALNVFGGYVDFNGFRVRGAYSNNSTRTLGFAAQVSPGSLSADISTAMEGFSTATALSTLPLSTSNDEMWVAVFAAATAADSNAKIVLIPYLKITAYNSSTRVATVSSSIKTPTTNNLKEMTSGYFVNGDALICSANGVLSNQVVTVSANTSTSLTLTGVPNNTYLPSSFFSPTAPAVDYDYILLAPRGASLATYDYKYLRSFKVDFTAGSSSFAWRSFSVSGSETYVYTGAINSGTTNITYDPGTASMINFRDQVSPLATGVIGSMQAYSSSANTSPAAYIAHDAADNPSGTNGHTIQTGSRNNIKYANGGGSRNFIASLTRDKQWFYAKVDTSTTTGKIVLRGHVED